MDGNPRDSMYNDDSREDVMAGSFYPSSFDSLRQARDLLVSESEKTDLPETDYYLENRSGENHPSATVPP